MLPCHRLLLFSGLVHVRAKLWDYSLLRLEEVIVAHRQEITCVRFLDPLPCLATADMTGKVLLWATRPHPNGGALLLVIRNTVITAGHPMPGPAQEPPARRARVQRKVLPTPVTCIAFRHNTPVRVKLGDTNGAQRVRQDKTAVNGDETSEALGRRADTGRAENRPSLSGQEPQSSAAETETSKTPPAPWEVGSILFTGDELGSIKAWDLTEIVLEKLGPTTTYGAKATEDKATISPSLFGAASHHFIHYRDGPLDGVGLQAAVRFRELIDIARVLRRGDHLKIATPDPDSLARLRRAGQDSGVKASGGSKKTTRPPPEVKSSAGSLGASSTTERSRDCSSAARRKQELGLDRSTQSRATGSPKKSASGTLPDVCGNQQRDHRRLGPKEYAEATLNAKPDDVDPVASWKGHEDSITSMQIVAHPPSLLTGSLDSSARLFSLNGSLLGVMEKNNTGGKTNPWLFEPPSIGRKTEARDRTSALEPKLKRVRQEERQPVLAAGGAVTSEVATDLPAKGRSTLTSPPLTAPVDGSLLGPTSPPRGRGPKGQGRGTRDGWAPPSSGISADGAREGKRAAVVGKASFPPQSTISAMCLSRIKELTQVRDTAPTGCSESGSDGVGIGKDGIEQRLLDEAREGRRSPTLSVGKDGGREKRRGYHRHNDPASRGGSEPLLLSQKLPPNLTAERERKHGKRTRSTQQFLANGLTRTSTGVDAKPTLPSPVMPSVQQEEIRDMGVSSVMDGAQGRELRLGGRPSTSPGIRAKGPAKGEKFLTRDDSVTTLPETRGLSPASKLRHAVVMVAPFLGLRPEETSAQTAPVLDGDEGGLERLRAGGENGVPNTGHAEKAGNMPPALRSMVPLAQRSTGNMLQTQRSVMTLASARSNRSTVSNKPAISTKAAVARRLAADHRRRRMDCIMDRVRRIGQRDVGHVESSPGTQDETMACPRIRDDDDETTLGEEMVGECGPAAAGEARVGTVIISTRVQEVISRFERSVNDEEADGDNASDNQADQRVKNVRRQLEARTAARQEAIKHNERYRRAQRYDLIALQETQQRRQEAMVGLTGPSGERFGPYSLEDVLEFQAFVNYLNANGAEHMTVRSLIENPDIQADPYSNALLQELTRSRVLQWNQPLPLEDLMQVYMSMGLLDMKLHREVQRVIRRLLHRLPHCSRDTDARLQNWRVDVVAVTCVRCLFGDLIALVKYGIFAFRFTSSHKQIRSLSIVPSPLFPTLPPSTSTPQLVFHFAKHEEAKRMLAVMDIAALLERLRDAFVVDKDSLTGKNGSLPFHFVNDIDMAFRVCNVLPSRVYMCLS